MRFVVQLGNVFYIFDTERSVLFVFVHAYIFTFICACRCMFIYMYINSNSLFLSMSVTDTVAQWVEHWRDKPRALIRILACVRFLFVPLRSCFLCYPGEAMEGPISTGVCKIQQC